MAKVGKSEAQQEYNKQRRKLIREIEQATQRGFIFPEDVLPKVPTKITHKHVEELKKITPSRLFKSSEYVDVETGEVFTYEQIKPVLHNAIGNIKQAKEDAKKLSLHTPAVKDPKEILSEEERKQRNVERGRKAWETRRARMTDEEYGEFRKLFQERMAQSRAKKKGEPYYPTLTAIDAVHDKLETLSRDIDSLGDTFKQLQREVPPSCEPMFSDMKSQLIELYDDMIMYHESNDTIQEYEEYLISNMEKIDNYLIVIRYASGKDAPDKVGTNFTWLMALLNQGSLTPMQAETLGRMMDGSYAIEDQ